MVRNLAVGVLRKLPPGSELDDLVADGNMGLIRAIESFDPGRGFKFQTYAIPVIRGAIFNGIRRLDWVPERTRTKARALQQAKERLQASSGEEPSEEQLAEELKISTDEVYELIASLSTAYLLSLDQPIGANDESETAYYDVVQDEGENPFLEIEFKEEREALSLAIKRLDEREQAIITMHYFDGVTFEAISRNLGVSKQRISQLHQRAVRDLRSFIGDETVSPEALQGFTYEA